MDDLGLMFEHRLVEFDPRQPRDWRGRWTDTGIGGPGFRIGDPEDRETLDTVSKNLRRVGFDVPERDFWRWVRKQSHGEQEGDPVARGRLLAVVGALMEQGVARESIVNRADIEDPDQFPWQDAENVWRWHWERRSGPENVGPILEARAKQPHANPPYFRRNGAGAYVRNDNLDEWADAVKVRAQAVDELVSQDMGRQGRWNGIVKWEHETARWPYKGTKDWSCHITMSANALAGNYGNGDSFLMPVLIHEMLHGYSGRGRREDPMMAKRRGKAYAEAKGWEEGVVESLQREMRPSILAEMERRGLITRGRLPQTPAESGGVPIVPDDDTLAATIDGPKHPYTPYVRGMRALHALLWPQFSFSEFLRMMLDMEIQDRPSFVRGRSMSQGSNEVDRAVGEWLRLPESKRWKPAALARLEELAG